MTPQEVNRVANLPEWTTVLEAMIKSRRADLAFRTTKQEWWNQRAQDRQAHQNFLEEHRGTGKFSGKYAPQPQQTELIWTMPWAVKKSPSQNVWPRINSLIKTARSAVSKNRAERGFFCGVSRENLKT